VYRKSVIAGCLLLFYGGKITEGKKEEKKSSFCERLRMVIKLISESPCRQSKYYIFGGKITCKIAPVSSLSPQQAKQDVMLISFLDFYL
jgi:hypothetical protein